MIGARAVTQRLVFVGLERYRRLALDLVLLGSLEHIDFFKARAERSIEKTIGWKKEDRRGSAAMSTAWFQRILPSDKVRTINRGMT